MSSVHYIHIPLAVFGANANLKIIIASAEALWGGEDHLFTGAKLPKSCITSNTRRKHEGKCLKEQANLAAKKGSVMMQTAWIKNSYIWEKPSHIVSCCYSSV